MDLSPSRLRAWILATALVSSLSLSGCFKLERKVEIYPDGSGRISMSIGLHPMLTMLGALGGDEGEGGGSDPTQEALDGMKSMGGVRWSPPSQETRDGWTFTKLQGVFADINQVGNDSLAHQLERSSDGGFRLVVTETSEEESATPDGSELDNPMLQGLVKQLLDDLLIRSRYTLPGTLRSIPPSPFFKRVEGQPRSVEMLVRGSDIKDPSQLQASMKELSGKPQVFMSGPADEEALREGWDALKRALAAEGMNATKPSPAARAARQHTNRETRRLPDGRSATLY